MDNYVTGTAIRTLRAKQFPNGKQEFPIVKDTTPQTHAYTASQTPNFGGAPYEKTDFL